MSKRYKFLWFDDNPNKIKDEAENLQAELNVKIDVISLKNARITNKLNSIFSGYREQGQPDLILMDHKLTDVADNEFKTGSTAAEMIREQWPQCPIICITAVPINDIDIHKKWIYEDLFSVDKISNHYSTIKTIARSFRKLRKDPPSNMDDIIRLLNAPKDDKERLKVIMPDDLKRAFNDHSYFNRFYKWIKTHLIQKPGFLYDRLWISTYIGLKEKGFDKVEYIFENAKYKGIFSDDNYQRWWKSRISNVLLSHTSDPKEVLPWRLGRKLPSINENDHSICYVTHKPDPIPETVAYIDESADERAPMCLRYTVSHPNFGASLFFEEIRMMKGEQ